MKIKKIIKHIEKYNNNLAKIIDDTYKYKLHSRDVYNLIALENRLSILNSVYEQSKKLEDKIKKELEVE